VTCGNFCSSSVCTEEQEPDKGTKSNGKHNPAIICHEKQHDEEGIKDLDAIQDGLDNMGFLINLDLVSSRELVHILGHMCFVPAGCFADCFVAGRQEGNAYEREEESCRRGDVP